MDQVLRDQFAAQILARKQQLMEEIRRGLADAGHEHVVDMLSGAHDLGDEAAASLVRDIKEAEVVRDIGEVRDIIAAEARLASHQFGICLDCGSEIDTRRLEAYPTAKRCISCQQHREKTRALSKYTGH